MKNNRELALDLNANIWINANAGSGKTTILIKRLISLIIKNKKLYNILAITYTKAAANEIKERIGASFQKIINANASDEETKNSIKSEINCQGMKWDEIYSNTLYLINKQEDLRVSTIHSFCSSVIATEEKYSQYNSSPSEQQINDIRETVMYEAWKRISDEKIIPDELIENISESAINEVIDYGIKESAYIKRTTNLRAAIAEIEFYDPKDNIDQLINSFNFADLQNCELNKYFQKKYLTILKILENKEVINLKDKLRILELNLNTNKDKICTTLMKKSQQANPEIFENLTNFQEKCLESYNNYKKYASQLTNIIMLKILKIAAHIFNQEKEKRQILDYSDLLFLAKEITAKEYSSFKSNIQIYIDHIFLDEAQDTNEISWSIINNISDDFFSGTSESLKTIFVVGDEKQSIYSFQGSDINLFHAQRNMFAQKIAKAKGLFHFISLKESFRTEQKILNITDKILNKYKDEIKIDSVKHIAKKNYDNSGIFLIDIAKEDKSANKQELIDWNPDLINKDSEADINYIEKVVNIIKEEISNGTKPEEIMVLTESRSSRNNLFAKIISKITDLGIETSGVDKFKISKHLLYQDLVTFVHFFHNSNNPVTLARLARSFYFNNSVKESIDIAKAKTLEETKEINLYFYQKANKIFNIAKHHSPQAALNKIFTCQDSFDKINQNYGTQGGQVRNDIIRIINASKNQFQTTSQSLNSIALDFESDNRIGKQGVFFTTIHSSKGLESRVVIILDLKESISSRSSSKVNKIQIFQDDFIYIPKKKFKSMHLQMLHEKIKDLQNIEKMRLSYVALTRAKSRLYVVGTVNDKKNTGGFADKNLITLCKESE